MKDCENLPLVPFEAIQCNLPEISNTHDLSTDQRYLFDICQAIGSGICSDGLKKRNPGKVVHSRWLTTGNRILRLYLSTLTPSENLLLLVNFIMQVYAPMWFQIKTRPLCIYGAQHLQKTIMLTRYLPENLKLVVDPVIQRNGYFGHPENILIAMIADERETIRILALRRVKKAREQLGTSSNSVRSFVLPKFNFNSKDYIDIIDWNVGILCDPPILRIIGLDVISDCIQNPKLIGTLILPFIKDYPCHTQATERCVKIVTEASAAVCSPMRRDGFIRTRIESRKKMPFFNSKKDFKIL